MTLQVGPLVLRRVTLQDVDALTQHWNRRAVRRYLWDGQPVLSSMVDAVVRGSLDDWEQRGVGLFAVMAQSRLVGSAGLRSMAGTTVRAPRRTDEAPELVVSLDHSYQGRGLGTALAHAVLDDARSRGVVDMVVAVWDPSNVASQRGLATLGFEAAGTMVVLGAELPVGRWRG